MNFTTSSLLALLLIIYPAKNRKSTSKPFLPTNHTEVIIIVASLSLLYAKIICLTDGNLELDHKKASSWRHKSDSTKTAELMQRFSNSEMLLVLTYSSGKKRVQLYSKSLYFKQVDTVTVRQRVTTTLAH